jgi:hypothetical protein
MAMIYFVNFSGDPKAQSNDQGVLFEKLVKRIVDNLGYKDIDLRVKISGKEYDIRAIAKLGGRKLIGEAKARRENQTLSVITSFVGSLDHEDLPADTLGLFISISDLTPEARDWLGKTIKRDRIEIIVDQEIFERLAQIGYATTKQVKKWAESKFQMRSGDTHLLVSEQGDFFIQTLARINEARIKAFCVYDSNGNQIEEEALGQNIKKRVEDFQELFFLPHPQSFVTHLDDTPVIIGVDREGAGWFEHKLPAHPDRFIGRKIKIQDFINYIHDVLNNKTNIRVYQVLSLSGVGKSSFLLKIHSETKSIGVAIFQDARNFRGAVDLLSLLQEFVEDGFKKFDVQERVPSDRSGVFENLSKIDSELTNQNIVGVLFVDQFESLFLKPELYIDFMDLVLEIIHRCKNIVVCLARKNDQPTTFDDRDRINLSRLIQISKSVELTDFSSDEALELISHLDEEIKQRLKPKLRDLILEFSATGFPWLVKRTGAHIRDMIIKHKMSQIELIQNGVRKDELIKEDLAELDIVDREFLKEIAHYLPATIDDLSQIEKFRGQLLPNKLRLFQDQRLIRLIGRTYDTYNDVFKHYLKYGEIPRLNKYTFRTSPTTSIALLRMILSNRMRTTEEIKNTSSLDPGTVRNSLRELRMLELIDYERGQLKIYEEAINSFERGELDLYIKERVWRSNGLVKDIVNRITPERELELKELVGIMKQIMPLLELSKKTWETYARTLVSWLRYVGLTNPGAITADGRAIGVTRRGRRSDYFLPSSYVRQIISLMESFGEREIIPASELQRIRWVKSDCIQIGLIEEDKEKNAHLTLSGNEFILNQLSRPRFFRDFLLDLDYVNKYLTHIENQQRSHLESLKHTLGDTGFTEETWIWRSKILANWLEFADIIQRKAGKIIVNKQRRLFES